MFFVSLSGLFVLVYLWPAHTASLSVVLLCLFVYLEARSFSLLFLWYLYSVLHYFLFSWLSCYDSIELFQLTTSEFITVGAALTLIIKYSDHTRFLPFQLQCTN